MDIRKPFKFGGKILLVGLQADGDSMLNRAPPLGVYQLQYYITEQGFGCDLLDRELEGPEEYVRKAEAGEYSVIGISAAHESMLRDLDLIWQFKQAVRKSGKPAIFIAGGQAAALNYEQWLVSGIDIVFLGFSELALLAFCQRLEQTDPWNEEKLELTGLLEGINGLAFQNPEGGFVKRPTLPFADGEFKHIFYDQVMKIDFPFHQYWDLYRKHAAGLNLGASRFIIENARIYSVSHCPRLCGFCNSQNFLPYSSQKKLPITMLSAEEVGDLVLKYVKGYGAKSFVFSDDDFPVGSKLGLDRLRKFCELIIDYKDRGAIPHETQFACQARIRDFTIGPSKNLKPNLKLMELMVAARFLTCGMGVETFTDRMLRAPSVNKVGQTVEIAKMVLDAMIEIGMTPQMNIIFGIPEYTPEEMAETLDIAVGYIRKNCEVAVTRYMKALPGAPMYDMESYERTYHEWTHPDNGKKLYIADRFIPQHPMIKNLVENIIPAEAVELEKIIVKNGWQGKTIIHKRVSGMARFIAAAKLLEREDLYIKFSETLDELLEIARSREEAKIVEQPTQQSYNLTLL